MKRTQLNIICSWLFLLCFIAGQFAVSIHQHNILKPGKYTSEIAKHNEGSTTTVQEKCHLCDAMHHTAMVFEQVSYSHLIVVADHIYTVGDYNFTSISLILAAGRGPPVAFSAC